LLPEEVIREAVVNAFMHRSYRRQEPLLVIRYANRLEIRNAGASLKHEDAFGTPGSVPRNPSIAAIFHETGIAETKGSGIRVMRQHMEAAGLARPLLVPDRRDDRFIATFLFHHFLDREDLDWLMPFEPLSLTMPERAALIFVRETGAIDHLALRQVVGLEPGAASAALRRLRAFGLLDAFGRGPGTYYRPAGLLATVLHPPAAAAPTSPALSQDPSALSQDLRALSQDLQALSQDLQALSQDPARASLRLASLSSPEAAGLPQDLTAIVARAGKRARPGVVEEVLVRLCAHRPFSSDELATLLGRDAGYLVRAYLTPLVATGRLERTYPQMVNHPDQAYRAPADKEHLDAARSQVLDALAEQAQALKMGYE
jgi:ATP-dependent DNA helicase RecG